MYCLQLKAMDAFINMTKEECISQPDRTKWAKPLIGDGGQQYRSVMRCIENHPDLAVLYKSDLDLWPPLIVWCIKDMRKSDVDLVCWPYYVVEYNVFVLI